MTDGLGRPDELPRVRLAPDPTPLERLTNLARESAGPRPHVKRDRGVVPLFSQMVGSGEIHRYRDLELRPDQ